MIEGAATLIPNTIYWSLLRSFVSRLMHILLKNGSLPAVNLLTAETELTELDSMFGACMFFCSFSDLSSKVCQVLGDILTFTVHEPCRAGDEYVQKLTSLSMIIRRPVNQVLRVWVVV